MPLCRNSAVAMHRLILRNNLKENWLPSILLNNSSIFKQKYQILDDPNLLNVRNCCFSLSFLKVYDTSFGLGQKMQFEDKNLGSRKLG